MFTGRKEKGWGYEHCWVSNEMYCSKFLYFKQGKQMSMHFHQNKHETWLVQEGKFMLITMDMKTTEQTSEILTVGDVFEIPPMVPHQLRCLVVGHILEVSTRDEEEDNYRIIPGDSQKGKRP